MSTRSKAAPPPADSTAQRVRESECGHTNRLASDPRRCCSCGAVDLPMREPDDDLKFDGSSGRKPSAEARRYIYRVLATALETDMRDHEGWMRDGITNDFDLRRLRKAAKLVVAELIRKGRR